MQSIILLFANLMLVLIDCAEGFICLCSKSLFDIRQGDPAIINLLNVLKDSFVIYLQAYNCAFTLQFILYWFPNVNPFIQPFYMLRVLTGPFILGVRKFLPPLFGFDLSFFVCTYIISLSIKFLTKFKF